MLAEALNCDLSELVGTKYNKESSFKTKNCEMIGLIKRLWAMVLQTRTVVFIFAKKMAIILIDVSFRMIRNFVQLEIIIKLAKRVPASS